MNTEISADENYQYFTNLVAELPPIHKDSITSRTLFSNDRIKVIIFGFASGQEDVVLGTEKIQAQAGTWAHLPAQLAHSVYATTDLVMLLILLQE
jgi:hypothetical protein